MREFTARRTVGSQLSIDKKMYTSLSSESACLDLLRHRKIWDITNAKGFASPAVFVAAHQHQRVLH